MADLSAAFPPHDVRIFVILGAYGAGKTEFSVNLALALAARGRRTALADLDIVNPYFRSREKSALLANKGVRLIAPQGELRDADLPVFPADLRTLLDDTGLTGVIDLGGDPAGARALAAFSGDLLSLHPAVWYVLNRSRFENADARRAIQSLQGIQAVLGLRVTGLVSNTHLLSDTDAALVREGAAFAGLLAVLTGLPVACHAVRDSLAPELADLHPLFPMTLRMNRPWEDNWED